ncbi:FxSxx-COOH system tetratricopeptide repeat protein [Amycolatopsis sp. NPDC051045]|uniref:FxSxx-COOH system tetratricopeptide repeat protein n=1 Tax=Amycolatopsis sp. NPDC051045 TaxID=3156922 RepID=UPI0034353BD4
MTGLRREGERLSPVGPPPLRTVDLTWREVRDVLYLAFRLSPPGEAAATLSPRPAAVSPPPPPPTPTPPPDRGFPTVDDSEADEHGRQQRKAETAAARQDWGPVTSRTVRAVDPFLDEGREAAPLLWPTLPALAEAREIARALRPLARSVPSPWKEVLDEEATAVRAAEDGLWLPVWKPDQWRRFDLTLVVDTATSMELWQPTVEEFRELTRRLGAFRDVRTHLVDCSQPTGELRLRPEGHSGNEYRPRDLVDPAGRRLVLVLTDAVAVAWRNGAAQQMLADWRDMPVAVLNMLPQRLWTWGGLSPVRLRLSAPVPGAPNRALKAHSRTPHGGWAEEPAEGAVVVPVLELSPDWMTGWADLVANARPVETTAILARRDHGDQSAGEAPVDVPDDDRNPRSRVLKFRTYASAQAFQLAGLLAAAPLNLPTMRLVQRVLLPGSGLPALAEVLLGGLLHRVPAVGSPADPAAVTFEFREGVRAELLSSERRDVTVRVARVLGRYAGEKIAALRNYQEAVDNPDTTVRLDASAENLPYIRVQEVVFKALSGRYLRRAKKLDAVLRPRSTGPVADANGRSDKVVNNSTSESIQEVKDNDLNATSVPVSPGEPADTLVPPGGDDAVTSPGSRLPVVHTERLPGRPQIWGSVPLRNPDFVGRTELLERLRSRLVQAGGATAVLPEALHGMGGVGKSQTVVEYIYRHASEYDVIWWIPSEHDTQISSSMVELSKRLGLQVPSTADAAVPAVLEALRKGEPFSRWLLIFDNADRPDIVSRFFPAISTESGHIVVTSRNSQWSGVARTVEVDLFTREESKELLRRAGGGVTEEEADELAEALGDLPLAIEQAAAWRAQTGMPVSEYLELLDQNLAELMEDDVSADYQRSVAAAWNVPLSRLRTAHPAALQLLQVCAFFGPEPIARGLFTGVRAAPVPEELAKALSEPIRLNRAIREISRYSLARLDHRSNTLQLHRLVQSVLKNQLPEADRDLMRHAVHILLAHGDPGEPENSLNWSRYAELLPHAMVSRVIECRSDAWVRGLVINLVRYLISSGDYRGARETSSQALAEWRANFGETDPDTLSMARLQGVSLSRLGLAAEARELNARTFEQVRETMGEENELFLNVANTVRQDMRLEGRFDRELEMGEDIFERSRRVLGEDDPATLAAGNNLAGSLRLNGLFFRARDLDEDIWRRKKIVLGEEHIDTFLTLNALAMDLRECGLYVEACRLQEETLERQREVVGADHPRTIGAMRNLAVARRKAGLHDGAYELSVECVERYRRRHGDQHLDTITSETCLAADLRHLGDLAESRRICESSYRVFVESYGPQHPFTLVSAITLGITLRLIGDVERACELDRNTTDALKSVFGGDHPFTMVSAANLASDLAARGEVEAARELDLETLERSGRTLGKDHPATLAVALNLSLDLKALGEGEEANRLHAVTVEGLRKALGDDHPAIASAVKSERANCDTDTMQL